MLKFFLIFIVVIFCLETIQPEPCSNPNMSRSQVFIYRLAQEIKVNVYHCKFKYNVRLSLTYSDISRNCRIAVGTGVLKDKWGDQIKLNAVGSRLVLKEYVAKADIIRNEIELRSGTVCRYDRGFCYDPKESVNYAVVWDLNHKPTEKCPKQAKEQVFYGYTDLWEFPSKGLKYLFYYDDHRDEAFYVKLTESVECNNKTIWNTDRTGFVVSKEKLRTTSKPTSKFYFPIKSKRIISAAILRNCDLQEYMMNLERNHVLSNDMANVLVELYKKLKTETKTEIEQDLPNDFRNATIDIRSS